MVRGPLDQRDLDQVASNKRSACGQARCRNAGQVIDSSNRSRDLKQLIGASRCVHRGAQNHRGGTRNRQVAFHKLLAIGRTAAQIQQNPLIRRIIRQHRSARQNQVILQLKRLHLLDGIVYILVRV